jgi:hypothetical protein
LFSRTKALLKGHKFQSAQMLREPTMVTLMEVIKNTGKDLQGSSSKGYRH